MRLAKTAKATKAVAVFQTAAVEGEAVAEPHPNRRRTLRLRVRFTKLPAGYHGFHIHRAGDLRGHGCMGACDHWHVGPPAHHGGPPTTRKRSNRHTGDLGNIKGPRFSRTYAIPGVAAKDLWGRSLIVHADKDDLGTGEHPDSKTTGHSGPRIACAIFGRA